MSRVIADLPSQVVGGLVTFLIIAAGSLFVGPVRHRLREVLIGPRLLVHIWTEVVIDGRKRRLIPWDQLVVGLGADPIYRGTLEPRLEQRLDLIEKWGGIRKHLVQPMYPLNKTSALAGSLTAVHLVIWNKSRNVVLPRDADRFTVLVDLPELHVLDWARGTFDEPGWDRSRDPDLEGDKLTMGIWAYEYQRSAQLKPGPTSLTIGLRHAIRPGESQRDVLAVLSQSGHEFDVTVRSESQHIPLLVKPWPPAMPWTRLLHPVRTAWRRFFVASRVPPVHED